MINFNSPNKKTGDNFEDDVVSLLQENGCTGIQKNLTIKDLGIEVDVCYIEDGKLEYPKDKDLIWDKSSINGRQRLDGMPYIDGDMTEYNTKNVNAHKSHKVEVMGNLETFL